MIDLDAAALDRRLDYPSLIAALHEAFAGDADAPVRHHHAVPVPGAGDATLLLMPAWQVGDTIGVKVATVFPDNGTRGLPSVMATYLLLDGRTGSPLAICDGNALTRRRTGAASALAASFLARDDARALVMVGTGALAPELIAAHASVRPIERVSIWGRTPARARALAERLAGASFDVRAVDDLEAAVRDADVVSCATLAREPLLCGAWLRAGAHVDLVGGFTPDRREADDETVRRSRIYVDTRAGALAEAGDLVQPIADDTIRASDVCGDLRELARGQVSGRQSRDEITLFKSVGHALEDLAAARLAHARASS